MTAFMQSLMVTRGALRSEESFCMLACRPPSPLMPRRVSASE